MNEKTKIVMLPAECLEHHPENPRKEIGDIAELTDSIKANGILQNLTVVPKPDDEGKYLVVIGNRRYEAGLRSRLSEISEPAPKSDNIDKYKKEREEIKSLISDMYARHMDFIENYNKKPKSVPGIALLCIDTISKLFTTDGLEGVSNVDLDDVTDYISEKHFEIYVENADTLSDYYKSNILRFYIQLTTALLDVKNIYSDLWYREVNQSIGYSGNGNYTTYSYNRTQKIKIFADFIEHLGYVMSDEEKQLIDGTHRLYHLEDNEEAE